MPIILLTWYWTALREWQWWEVRTSPQATSGLDEGQLPVQSSPPRTSFAGIYEQQHRLHSPPIPADGEWAINNTNVKSTTSRFNRRLSSSCWCFLRTLSTDACWSDLLRGERNSLPARGVMSKSEEKGTYARAPLFLSISSCSEDLEAEAAVENGCILEKIARPVIRLAAWCRKRRESREEIIALVEDETGKTGEIENNRGSSVGRQFDLLPQNARSIACLFAIWSYDRGIDLWKAFLWFLHTRQWVCPSLGWRWSMSFER